MFSAGIQSSTRSAAHYDFDNTGSDSPGFDGLGFDREPRLVLCNVL